MTTIKCKDCGSKPCICEDEGKWAAHCMDCDNSTGEKGFYSPIHETEKEATEAWNRLNK